MFPSAPDFQPAFPDAPNPLSTSGVLPTDSHDAQPPANAVPSEDWDAAKNVLSALTLQRPECIRIVAAALQQAKQQGAAEYARARLSWLNQVGSCGHAYRAWLAKEETTPAAFVAEPEKHGYCVICRETAELREKLAEVVESKRVLFFEFSELRESLDRERKDQRFRPHEFVD
jgi:hypothetical protein